MSASSQDWQPIATAPKDGRTILIREGKWAPTHAYWHVNDWRHIEYQHTNRPTHWMPRESQQDFRTENKS